MNLSTYKIKKFLLLASQSTYASEDNSIRIKQKDFSTTITYRSGDFLYHDNYFGGEPYGGREVIFFQEKPIWMMVYYGWVKDKKNTDEIYKILTMALRKSTIEMPYRGPNELIHNNMKYVNKVEGEFTNFDGIENIFDSDGCIYQARYIGGLIDKK